MDMNRRNFIKATACMAAAVIDAHGLATEPYEIGVYYFPDFHVDPRNEFMHGKGWTEWEILKRGEPKFAGHHQPKRPMWGMEDESEPSVFEKKIECIEKISGKPSLNPLCEGEVLRRRCVECCCSRSEK